MKLIWILLFVLAPFTVSAEEKECTVEKMHCDACKDMVKDRLCNDTHEVCDVTLKNKVGKVHMKTKDAAAKLDEKAMAKALEDTTYKLGKCTATKAKAAM